MADWGFWEWLAYGLIAIAAFMPALAIAVNAEQTLREKLAAITESRWWKFTPAAAVVVSACIVAANQFGLIRHPQEGATWPDNYKPTVISAKHFANVDVPLDGHEYDGNTFDHVRFRYEGTTPIRMNNNTLTNFLGFVSGNSVVLESLNIGRQVDALLNQKGCQSTSPDVEFDSHVGNLTVKKNKAYGCSQFLTLKGPVDKGDVEENEIHK